MFVQRVGHLSFLRPFEGFFFSESIVRIAQKCLQELAVSFVIAAAVALFVPSPMGTALLLSALKVQLAVNLMLLSIGELSQKCAPVCEWGRAISFAIFTGLNAQFLIHETGHFLAALFLYKNSGPSITIIPFAGGVTFRLKAPLSLLGKTLGPAAVGILWTAGGPICALLVSAALLEASQAMRDQYPQLRKYLLCWSAIDFLNHARYALSALKPNPSNHLHDFVKLSKMGLHPAAAVIAILAIPMIVGVKRAGEPGPIFVF